MRDIENVMAMCSLLLMQIGLNSDEIEGEEVMVDFVEGRLTFLEKTILNKVGIEEFKPIIKECWLRV